MMRAAYSKSLLIVFVNAFFFVSLVNAGENIKGRPWQSDLDRGEIEEKVNMRTRNSKTFSSGNNKERLFTTPSSIHYDKNGDWKDINLEITVNNTGTYPEYRYASVENSYKSYYPADLSSNRPVVVVNGQKVVESVTGLYFTDGQNDILKLKPQFSHSADLNGNSISYPNYFQGADLKFTQLNDARKMDVVIHDKSFLNNLPQGAEFVEIVEVIELPRDWYLKESEYGISIYSMTEGSEIVFIPLPKAVETEDSEKEYEHENDLMIQGDLTFQKLGEGKYEIRTRFPLNWLLEESRNFPVALDPTINVSPMLNSNFWTGSMGGLSAAKSDGIIRVAGFGSLGWAKFDLSAIPPAVLFLDAVYHGYKYIGWGNSKIANIIGMETVDPVQSLNTAISNHVILGPVYNNNYIFGGSSDGWYSGQIDTGFLSAIAVEADSQGWTALGFRYDSGDHSFMYQSGHNAVSNVCYMEIEYVFPYDAGVASIDTPGIPNCVNNELFVKITTVSPYPLTSVIVDWTVNGVSQSPLNWTGFLTPAGTMQQPIHVGNFNFQQGDVIKVWTTDPNGFQDGFPANDTFTFTIPAFPTSNMAEEELLCHGKTITLKTDVHFAGHQWSTGSVLPQITVNQPGVYGVTITDNYTGCQHDYEVNVIQDDPVKLPDTLVKGCAELGGVTISGNKAGGNYLWNNGSQDSVLNVTESGTYWVQVADSTLTCLSSDTVEVEIFNHPDPRFVQSRDFLTVNFTNNSRYADYYLWDFGDGQTSTHFEPVYTYTQPGFYNVGLTAFNFCGQRSVTNTIEVDPVSVGDIENPHDLNIYPNPSAGLFNVDFNTNDLNDVRLEIMDVQGRLIQSEQLGNITGNFTHQVNLGNVASGMYLVKIISGSEVVTVERISIK